MASNAQPLIRTGLHEVHIALKFLLLEILVTEDQLRRRAAIGAAGKPFLRALEQNIIITPAIKILENATSEPLKTLCFPASLCAKIQIVLLPK